VSAGREGEEIHMKSMRCIHKWATGFVALGLAASAAPISRAQAQSQNSSAAAPSASAPSSTATNSTETQKQLDNLQKQLTELQTQIAALKAAQSAPAVKTASMSSADASPSASAPMATPAADDAPAKISLAGLLGPTQISGLVDAYYQFNSNHPFDNASGFRYFDENTNAFSLNMAEIGVLKAPDASSTDARFGYHIVAGYGNAAFAVNSTDPATDDANFYLEQAYGSYLAPIGKGLQIDVGKFVTPIGAEVIESSGNWNYSRSLLFYYAIPYYHVGARATYTFNPKWTVAAYLVDGWNNTVICHYCDTEPNGPGFNPGGSAGLTYIGSVTWTPNAKWSVIENYTGGPIIGAYQSNLKSINDWKQLSDTVLSYTPNAKWAFMLNGDYGFGPKYYNSLIGPDEVSPSVKWWGTAGYAKYTLSAKSYAAVRYEYYDDTNGYTGLLAGDDGHAQEVTGTYAYNLTSGLQVRGEYRYDVASEPFFLAGADAFKKTQNTAELGFIYSFSSVNAK
jgi:Putative beta-barrel porin-2, OmpL-like. bbp2